ncbi:BPTI/Kunitz-type proteinase inhibitor domain-containing protein [Nannocystis sp. SCPEA4]|uniref:BPTI/Kunitz-type proteinase inhibitor domain-containing protein n=1 Tax=Nannocystis sp. SCPEA4 TaxID=2996787 RepID=UPI00226FE056|nr:BPTI/Kunitz-type proteinase inhibitor domain-containing protein [Nannocystis sp. SCPEA4]MCY1055995.1 BPTI/Kunitz-type proteinase inhibitor domain-containing protein [Nannocystis sp. SCPEA4]
MPTALPTRAALLACVTLACSPKSGETDTAPTTSTTDPGTSTVSQPGTSADPSSPMPNPTTGDGPVDACALEHDVPAEECDWLHTGYYFEAVSQTCKSFDYGDCGTPVVPFETLEACLVECEGCETDCSTSSGSSSG